MKKLSSFLVLALCLTAFAAAPATAASGLSQGDKGKRVIELQRFLVGFGYLPKVTGLYGEATGFAVTAFQKQEGLSRNGVAGPKTLARVAKAKRPRPRYYRSGNRIEVSLSKQLAYLITDGTVKRTIAIASGRSGYSTPSGSFKVFRKERNSWSVPYQVNLPFASYFVGGIAFHAYPEVPVYAASHGCVRVPTPFAAELYKFADFGVPVTLYY